MTLLETPHCEQGTSLCPPSASRLALNFTGVFAAVAAAWFLHGRHRSDPEAVGIVCLAGALPIIVVDVVFLRVHRRASTGLSWDRGANSDLARCATKLLGLGVTLGLIALAYYVFPEYSTFYNPFWNLLRRFWPSLVAGAVAYVWIVDGRMNEPEDAYWQLGRVALLRFSDARRETLANHFRTWLVKAFYIPLFIVYTQNQIGDILRYNLHHASYANLGLFYFSQQAIYALDVLYATVGYLLAFRIIDTHVRSAEPTMLGWAVALECYQPFWGRISSSNYLHYEGIGFERWLHGNLGLAWTWAAVVLALEAIYVLATFAFGVRFSNLTHRGIVTAGPYRFTKHPAYVAKNLSWWLVTVPFVPALGLGVAIKSSVALGCVNVIYFLRARTEERHLSRDPKYVEYALWMNEHGALRWLNRMPFFRYKAPDACAPAAHTAQGARAS